MGKLSKPLQKAVHVPMRTCIVTREKKAKRELVRFVYLKEDKKVVFDPTGKARGRGANLTNTLEIFDKAVESGAFSRAFKTRITREELLPLREELKSYIEKQAFRQGKTKIVVRVKSDEKVKLD